VKSGSVSAFGSSMDPDLKLYYRVVPDPHKTDADRDHWLSDTGTVTALKNTCIYN
jgi:hypothetical protein